MRAARRLSHTEVQPVTVLLAFRLGLALTLVCILVGAVTGGLVRAGSVAAWLRSFTWVGNAAVDHAALMLSSFFGSVIGVERAVALRQRWAFVPPLASAISGVLLLSGHAAAGAWSGLLASCVFVAVNFIFLFHQPHIHIALLLVSGLAWVGGNALFAIDQNAARALPWWFAFIVLTITAERLEMYRLMRCHVWAYPSLLVSVTGLLAGAALSSVNPVFGGVLYGSALAALALWLGVFDIARRTVLAQGVSRYMALCLLSGYAWMGVAGVAWIGTALGCPGRDMALHALGLGFIISMVMGHAPVILPAVANIKLLFGTWFYVPLVMLHASLLVRLFGGMVNPNLRAHGTQLNALALGCFVAAVAASAIAWRLQHHSNRPATVAE